MVASLDKQGWDRTALVRMHDTLPLARLARHDDPTFKLRRDSGFYDGAFFYAIARDPLATGQAHRLVPERSYHFGHPGYGWLAWLASAGGRPNDVPEGLLVVGMAAMLAAGAAASLLARLLGWTPWAGLAVALNPGLVFAVANDTSEPLGAALLLGALVAFLNGRRGWTFGLLAALCLVKEPLALVPLALAAWEYGRRRRGLFLAAAVLPAVVWWLYLRVHLGAPVPMGGETRIRILKTYTDAASYLVKDGQLVFARSLGIKRNVVLLPKGWELIECASPAIVSTDPDGRVRVSFVNDRDDQLPVRVVARRLP